ncbi:MAG: helix-turn-helix transcriptional regulator [Treponema sp.]|nr:helix-turn-helix transcriptional regulator [Treponema sp.]MCL2266516.1 helix-turn-helix transcriptional regulator [Treponema sp.]
MPLVNIGTLIKKLRIQQGITQEELAYPVIEQSTLSRIENGQTTPNKSTTEMLLERLGYNPGNIDIAVDKRTADIHKTMDELYALIKTESIYEDQAERTEKAEAIIKTLEADSEFMAERVNRQYILLNKAMCALHKKEDLQSVHEMLMEAMKISIPEYNEKDIDKYYLSKQDVRIINLTAMVYRDNGRLEDGIEVLSLLKKNFEETNIDKESKGEYYASVVYALATLLAYAKRYKEALDMCDRAAEVCKETGVFRLLPLIIAYKSQNMFNWGEKEGCLERVMPECIELAKQSYYASKMFDFHNWSDKIKNFAKIHLGLEL